MEVLGKHTMKKKVDTWMDRVIKNLPKTFKIFLQIILGLMIQSSKIFSINLIEKKFPENI